MLRRLCEGVVRRRWWVLGACLLATLVAALVGRGLFDRLGYSVFYDPAAESTRGAALARARLGEGDPDVVALYRLPDDLTVDDPGVKTAVAALLRRAAADSSVGRVVGPAGPLAERFVSADRHSTFVVVSLNGTPRTKAADLPRLRRVLDLELPGPATVVQPRLGGLVPSGRSLTRIAHESLARGERIALPLTGLLLVIIFGSLVAALLPLAIGGLSIVLALALLDLLSHVVPVDAFAVNVVTILGLGVAIDYALFLVSRYREELARGVAAGLKVGRALRRDALARALETAGRSVLFAGVTVAASLSGLLVFRQPFLRSVAVGGLAVTLLAAGLALLVLPALIDVLGDRLERGRLPWARRAGQRRFWRRLATAVIRRRVPVCVGVTLFLIALAVPFHRLQPSRADVRALPPSEEPRQVADLLQRDFPAASLQPISLMVTLDGELVQGDRLGQLYDYTERLRQVPGVVRVDSLLSFAGVRDRDGAEDLGPLLQRYAGRAASMPRGQPGLGAVLSGRYTLVRAVSSAPPDSPEAQRQVAALRAVAPPPAAHVLVFGQAAALYDFAASLRARAPWMLVMVILAMLAILTVAFHSVVLPVKAVLMTALSLTASFGAVVFVFQDGRLQRLLGYTALGTTDATLPVVLFAVVFGLSMDYEVLILNRMREAYLRTHDNRAAVIEGLAQTGRLVTSAALIMVVVFSAFAVAPVVFVKALGVGMALAVALDATVVRMLLVPSTMALLGRLNWWMPE